MTVFDFFAHYWLFTTATLACLWIVAVHLLRHKEVGAVGRKLAQRDAARTAAYLEAVTTESAELKSGDEPAV